MKRNDLSDQHPLRNAIGVSTSEGEVTRYLEGKRRRLPRIYRNAIKVAHAAEKQTRTQNAMATFLQQNEGRPRISKRGIMTGVSKFGMRSIGIAEETGCNPPARMISNEPDGRQTAR